MEILLTIMQSVVAVLLLANMRFEWWNATLLFSLWLVQFLRAGWREEITMIYAAWAVALLLWFVIRPPEAPRVFFRMVRRRGRARDKERAPPFDGARTVGNEEDF